LLVDCPKVNVRITTQDATPLQDHPHR
jgi:hypothetical protein